MEPTLVTVLHGGAQTTIADLVTSCWVNIDPDNSIDDDNNGFVDDYNGWHAQNNNDNIGGGGHGTLSTG